MRRVRPKPETLLAVGAAFVGFVSVVSALTPSIASRFDLVRGVLPPGVPSAARVVALAFGLALVWLSRSLARRRRRAWLLAVALVIGTAAAHLAKGLDAEEAALGLLLCAALVRYRRRFDVSGDPATVRPLVAASLALTSLVAFVVLYELHRLSAPERLEDLVSAAAALLAVPMLHLWLRPWTEKVRQSVGDRRRARALVDRHGHDSLSFFALRRDRSYHFSPSGGSFLSYRVVAGSALITGDPVGAPADFGPLIDDFRRLAGTRGWRLAALGASQDLVPLYRSLGLHVFKLGDEAIVRPAQFSLEGRAIRKVRQSVHRLQRAGYRVRIVRARQVDPSLRRRLDDVSAEWLGSWPERGFTMAMDDLFAEPDTVFAVAEDARGDVGGFLHLVPCPPGGGYSLGAMRRRRAVPNGLTEFLVAETIAWADREHASKLALNFCVFADVLREEATSPRRRAARFLVLRLDRLFQLRRLSSFSAKFLPEWEPRYVCFERLSDVPAVGLACLHVESLLTPPGPWLRRRRRRLAGSTM